VIATFDHHIRLYAGSADLSVVGSRRLFCSWWRRYFARASFEHLGHARTGNLAVTGKLECVDPSHSHFHSSLSRKRFEAALFM
jgi:hypothetical protein